MAKPSRPNAAAEPEHPADPPPFRALPTAHAVREGLRRALVMAVPATTVALAMAAFARFDRFPLASAEGRLLAWQALAVLAAAGALTRSWRLPACAGLLLVLGTWALPPTAVRGVFLSLALVATLLLATGLASQAGRSNAEGAASGAPTTHGPPWPASIFVLVAWALAWQCLARPDLLLLPWTPRQGVLLLVVPVVVGMALAWLARVRPGVDALLIGLVGALSPGWNLPVTAALVALAAGATAGDASRPRWLRAVAGVAMLTPLLLDLRLAPVAVTGGVVLGLVGLGADDGRRSMATARWALALPGVVLAAACLWTRPALEVIATPLLLVLVVLPAALRASGASRWLAASGALLVLAGASLHHELAWAAAGMALIAMSLPSSTAAPAATTQRAWGLALAGGALAAGAFPWLRAEPLLLLPGIFDLPWPSLAALAVLLVAGGSWVALRWRPARRWGSWLALAGATLLTLRALPAPGREVLRSEPTSLIAEKPVWKAPVSKRGKRAGRLIVESQLFHGANLPRGTMVARAIGRDAAGRELFVRPLRAGDDTADWASLRADVRAQPGFHAPSPWIHALAPDGTFFIPRFRASVPLPIDDALAELSLERAGELPPATEVALWWVELAP